MSKPSLNRSASDLKQFARPSVRTACPALGFAHLVSRYTATLPRWLSWLLTFHFVTFAWIFFRSSADRSRRFLKLISHFSQRHAPGICVRAALHRGDVHEPMEHHRPRPRTQRLRRVAASSPESSLNASDILTMLSCSADAPATGRSTLCVAIIGRPQRRHNAHARRSSSSGPACQSAVRLDLGIAVLLDCSPSPSRQHGSSANFIYASHRSSLLDRVSAKIGPTNAATASKNTGE